MSQREKKLLDIAQKLRQFKYTVQNFFHYRLLVNTKHLLIVGGSKTQLGEEIIDNFQNTWRIANIDFQPNSQCDLNILIKPENFTDKDQILKISDQIRAFSQHYQSIMCLGDVYTGPLTLQDESVFEKIDHQNVNKINLNLMAAHLSSQFLISNGLFMTLTDRNNFQSPITNDFPRYIANNQINYLNLSLGDREDLDIDSVSLALMLNKIGVPQKDDKKQQKTDPPAIESNNPDDQQIQIPINDQMDIQYRQQVLQFIRKWGEGQNRPISGSFATFNREKNIIYPVFL